MRINHVIKADQWRAAPQIRPAPHFVVSRFLVLKVASTFSVPPVEIVSDSSTRADSS